MTTDTRSCDCPTQPEPRTCLVVGQHVKHHYTGTTGTVLGIVDGVTIQWPSGRAWYSYTDARRLTVPA